MVMLVLDAARHDRDGAEFAHGARVAEDHAVENAPLDLGKRDAPEKLPAVRAEGQRRFLLRAALRLHERDQPARDEGKRDERGARTMPG